MTLKDRILPKSGDARYSFTFISEDWLWKQNMTYLTSTPALLSELSAGKFPEHILFHSPFIPSRRGPIKASCDTCFPCLVGPLLLRGMGEGFSAQQEK